MQTPKQYVNRLCRLCVGRNLGAHALYGPRTGTPRIPRSVALSPDKKWLYLTGLYESRMGEQGTGNNTTRTGWNYGVYRMAFEGDKPAELWQGHATRRGKDNKHFDYPTSVCVDAKGRVYVADTFNDRVQIYSPDGTLLKSLPVQGPAIVEIHHKTQELYVFSWTMALAFTWYGQYWTPKRKVPPALRVFEPFASDEPKRQLPLPLEINPGRTHLSQNAGDAVRLRATLNSYTDPPTLWMCTYHPQRPFGEGASDRYQISRSRLDKKKIVLLERWNDEVKKAVLETIPRRTTRRRMSVDHRTGLLYVEASSGPEDRRGHRYIAPAKSFAHLLRIDPASGKVERVALPMVADDFTIDDEGHLYLRKGKLIGRFDLDNMREVPFDYGERRSVSKHKTLMSALVLPGDGNSNGWESGMHVNSTGHLVVCSNNQGKKTSHPGIKRYTPPMYPGRFRQQGIHVFDRHGKVVHEDAVQGTPLGFGTFIDNRGDIYLVAGSSRIYSKGKDALRGTGCLMKFKPNKGKFYATGGAAVALSEDSPVKGLPRLWHTPRTTFFVAGAEWMFPGVGYVPQYTCLCWNSRFALDHFGRSFAPQHNRYQVAVLDTNGNLVVQIGRYGNIDDGLPLNPWKDRRTNPPRSIGGDEVALAYACYVGTHSDRYLFIYDAGNDCIKSVKLSYHVDRTVSLRDVTNESTGE
jgi:hypothetical protein